MFFTGFVQALLPLTGFVWIPYTFSAVIDFRRQNNKLDFHKKRPSCHFGPVTLKKVSALKALTLYRLFRIYSGFHFLLAY